MLDVMAVDYPQPLPSTLDIDNHDGDDDDYDDDDDVDDDDVEH